MGAENLRNKRIGEQNYNAQGQLMTIVEYTNCMDIVVEFDNTKARKHCRYEHFKEGVVKDNFYPSFKGIGYIGNTTVQKDNSKNERKESYITWQSMITRCYDKNIHVKKPHYKNCEVCEEWLSYENFERWYDENYYEVNGDRTHIDKDIICKHNKLYSPDTCVFVPLRINSLFTKCDNARGKYPIGVHYDKNYRKFVAAVSNVHSNKSRRYHCSFHETPEDAFLAYKEHKEKLIKQVADEYKDVIPQKLYDALYRYKVEITD